GYSPRRPRCVHLRGEPLRRGLGVHMDGAGEPSGRSDAGRYGWAVVLLLAPQDAQATTALVDAATELGREVADALGAVTSSSVVPRLTANPVAAYDETDAGGIQ